MDEQTIPVELQDVYDSSKSIKGSITINSQGIYVHLDGYGERVAEDGHGHPVVIEFCKGTPKLVVWNDINEEDPTHVISLDGAAENKRTGET